MIVTRRGMAAALARLSPEVLSQPMARHQIPVSAWRKGSKNCISSGDERSFEASRRSGDSDELLCQVGAYISTRLPNRLPRKELFEAHAVAQLVHRHFREESSHIIELCAGCGLLSVFLVLMDPRRRVRCLDMIQSPIAIKLLNCLSEEWPVLNKNIQWELQDFRHGSLEIGAEELATSCHACSFLSDEIILAATAAHRPFVLVPCCYEKRPVLPKRPWMPKWTWERWPWLEAGSVNHGGPAAIHAARVACLERAGYSVTMDHIDPAISNLNAALIARPGKHTITVGPASRDPLSGASIM